MKKLQNKKQQKERRQTMGSMKDLLIDAPCHSCGRIDVLQCVATTEDGKWVLWCDLCMCEEAEHQQETVRKEGK